MPELPEVETVRRTLTPLLGRQITGVWTSGLPLRLNAPVDARALREASVGKPVEAVRRLGKFLLIDLRGGDRSLLVHLGMSGRLRLMPAAEPRPPHSHVIWTLAGSPATELRFSDPRRFGQVSVLLRGREREHPSLSRLGPDPLTEPITGEHLYRLTRGSRRSIKALLLDQRAVAGIGNIYASEALWEARIRPTLAAGRLSRPRAEALAGAIRTVLDRALEHGGTSLRDFVAADGAAGDHAAYLWVYDRGGDPCLRCAGPIRRTVLQGRATFSCPRCQQR